MDRTDAELIDDFSSGSQDALTTLIRRHVDLVYASALRRCGDPGMADDVTQAVFIVFARKARSLRSRATVAGWLILVTRHVSRSAVRARNRRHHYEHAAARPEAVPMSNSDTAQGELASALDDALARLRAADRDAIALRFIQAHSLVDVGRTLGISEEAARKRVVRGLERLRESLARRGVVIEAAGLSDAIVKFAAPTAPRMTVENVIASTQATASEPAASLSKGTLRMFAFKQTALVSAIVLLGLSAIAAITALAQSTAASGAAAAPHSAPVATAPISAYTKRPIFMITTMAIQMPVTDVQANIAFFKKMGFRFRSAAKPDASGQLSWGTVDSGAVRIRMYQVASAPHPVKSLIPYFWIDGGQEALEALRSDIASQGVAVEPVSKSGESLLQINIVTPDGYTVGFYSAPD